jgi:hypothetical protein
MSRNIFDDSRDEKLTRALDEALPRPPVDDVDWSALHARIATAAQPLLQPQLVPVVEQAWWLPLARWSAAGIPLAAAASVLLMIGTARIGGGADATPGGFVMVEEELVSGAGAQAQPLLAGVEAMDMLDVALFSAGEEW